MLEIIPIPAYQDNYIWLGVNRQSKQAFVVDPGEAPQVIDYLTQHGLTLAAILVTHKHMDHTGGISDLLKVYPDVPVYAHATENVPTTTQFVKQGDRVQLTVLPDAFTVIDIPGHTLGHIAYSAPSILFTGDTLFGGGCGRVFEGTAEQMLMSLNKLAALPDDTAIYCGHEYTLANLRFAKMVEPENADIQARMIEVEKLRADNKPTLPSTLGLEKKTNPFLRCEVPAVIVRAEDCAGRELFSPAEVFHEIREWKNRL